MPWLPVLVVAASIRGTRRQAAGTRGAVARMKTIMLLLKPAMGGIGPRSPKGVAFDSMEIEVPWSDEAALIVLPGQGVRSIK